MSPPPCPRLEDHYRLGPLLGEGGFGRVYRASPREGGEDVAVKLPRGDLPAFARARVLREATLATRLDHPGLVGFRGLFTTADEVPALVYELLPGEDLDALLPPGPPAPGEREERLGWLDQVAGALDALHAQGLVHRDVKPGNVRILPDGSARLLDLGLLRGDARGGTVTATGVLVGTPGAMAPELFQGLPATPASDRYALACLAFWLLRGAFPVEGSVGEIADAALRGLPATRAREELDPGTSEPLAHALSPVPEERPESCRALSRALRGALGEASPPGASSRATVLLPRSLPRPDGPGEPEPAEPSPRRPPPGLLVLLLACLGLGMLVPLDPTPTNLPPTRSPASPHPTLSTGGPGTRRLEDLVDSVERELEELLAEHMDRDGFPCPPGPGTREALHRDPVTWHLAREQLPALRAFFREVGGGLRPEELSDPQRSRLRKLDEHLASRRIPPAFRPFLSTLPSPSPRELPPSSFRFLADRVPSGGPRLRFSPWETRCLELLEEIRQVREVYQEERARPDQIRRSQIFRVTPALASLLLGDQASLSFFIGNLAKVHPSRLHLYDWIEEGVDLSRTLLVAAGEALRGRSREQRVLGYHLATEGVDLVAPFVPLVGGLEGLHPAAGRLPETPEAVLFRGQLLRIENKRFRAMQIPEESAGEIEYWERLWRAPTLDPESASPLDAGWIQREVLGRLARAYAELEDPRGALRLLRDPRLLDWRPPDYTRMVWFQITTTLRDHPLPPPLALTQEEVATLRGVFRPGLADGASEIRGSSQDGFRRDVLALARRLEDWDPSREDR